MLVIKNSMKSYRDIEIYRESRRLAIVVHQMSLKLPKFEQYEEASQIRRSSKSVTSMIVEAMEGEDIKQTTLSISLMRKANAMKAVSTLTFYITLNP